MKIPPLHSNSTRCTVNPQQLPPADFIPLFQEARTHVSTAVLCWHLTKKEQTARAWASAETYPDGLMPVRVKGRLAWPVAGIKKLLGVA